jgi:hypothetical protein
MADAATSDLTAWQAAFDEYRTWSKRELGPLLETKARSVRWELWRQFKAIAKTPAALRDEIANLGYKIKRRIDPATGKTVDTDTEIGLRVKSLKFLSVSFLYQAWRASASGQSGDFDATAKAGRVGEAIVRTQSGTADPSVQLTSFLEGVVVQEQQRGIAARALAVQTADMETYIARKQQSDLAAHFDRIFTLTIPVA